MKLAFVFPGQGSQSVGMGKDIYLSDPRARAIFDQADHACGFALSKICFEGPEADLKQTCYTQPAIVCTSYALANMAVSAGLSPAVVAGHSVGEYTALAIAGVFSLQDAVRLVYQRGKLMDQACPYPAGGMAALIGMDEIQTQKMLSSVDFGSGIIDLAGLNCPGQVVVAGHAEALTLAMAKVREFGGRMGMALNVSGPFHSRLMQPAEEGLGRELAAIEFKNPACPVVPNVSGEFVTDTKVIRAQLMSQLTKPVLFEKSVKSILTSGIDTFIEFGAGNVLTGMIRKINKEAKIYSVHDKASLDKVQGELK